MAAQETPDSRSGILTQRIGPLATWVWLLIATIVVIVLAVAMRRKQGASQAQPGEAAGVQQVPDIILQNYYQDQDQGGAMPPGSVPPAPPAPTAPPAPAPTAPKRPIRSPVARHGPGPKPAPRNFTTVTVARWNATNAPWNSTLWGIATHYNVAGGYQELAKLNGIKNPDLIHPGQKIKVPVPVS